MGLSRGALGQVCLGRSGLLRERLRVLAGILGVDEAEVMVRAGEMPDEILEALEGTIGELVTGSLLRVVSLVNRGREGSMD